MTEGNPTVVRGFVIKRSATSKKFFNIARGEWADETEATLFASLGTAFIYGCEFGLMKKGYLIEPYRF